MKDKNAVVVAVGLIVILSIAVLVINENYESSQQLMKASEATNTMILQKKNFIIKKLIKTLKAKQAELAGLKTQLDGVNATLNTVKAELSVPAIPAQ